MHPHSPEPRKGTVAFEKSKSPNKAVLFGVNSDSSAYEGTPPLPYKGLLNYPPIGIR